MGFAIYLDKGSDTEVVPIAGQNEIKALWMPIIRQHGLKLIDIAVSGGLKVTEDVYSEFINEIETLLHEIEARHTRSEDQIDPPFRCRRFLTLLRNHPPTNESSSYVG
jgi:hypothetical protein